MHRLVSLTLLRGGVLGNRTLGGFMGEDVRLVWTTTFWFRGVVRETLHT